MNAQLTKTPDNAIQLTITVPSSEVAKLQEEITKKMRTQITHPGFRKGKAPPHLVEEKLDKEKVKEEVLKRIIPEYYLAALKQHNLNPIMHPRVHVEQFEEGKELVFTAQTCEEPHVNLKTYKEELKKLNATSHIIVPGREQKKPTLDETVDTLLKATEITLPKILIEQEQERLLAQFLDELKTLGLTLSQYLSSREKTGEDLRGEYEAKAEKNLKLEFLLKHIADLEHITVLQKDIDEVLSKIENESQKKQMQESSYLLSALIRQQKTLDFLTSL